MNKLYSGNAQASTKNGLANTCTGPGNYQGEVK
jgi:hypothetical protein